MKQNRPRRVFEHSPMPALYISPPSDELLEAIRCELEEDKEKMVITDLMHQKDMEIQKYCYYAILNKQRQCVGYSALLDPVYIANENELYLPITYGEFENAYRTIFKKYYNVVWTNEQ